MIGTTSRNMIGTNFPEHDRHNFPEVVAIAGV
jgi:hypothetical protein